MNQRVREVLFVGVGKMGLPMATHLHAAGHRVTAFDPSAERRALAAQRELAVVERLEPALARAPVVVSSLPDDAALRAVAAQVGAHAAAGAVWIDTSTVSPEASRDAAAQAAARGVACLRAPVSGNNVMAERAALTVFVSGDRAAYDACEPLFACWGPQRFWLGEAEQARIAKLAVNLMIVGTSTMLAEALALGERGGLEWQRLWDVVEASAVASPIVKAKAPALRAHDHTPTFTVEQMRKDVSLIRAAAPLDRAAAAGKGGDDYAVVIRDARRAH